MFRALNGLKAPYHSLTLLVASDFDEYRVLIQGPGVMIQGARQFSEAKAKEHARAIAVDYLSNQKKEDLPVLEPEWTPLAPGEFLNWRS
jgi:hypothetical protein